MNQNPELVDSGATWQRLLERVQGQYWPESALYVVATPIGNLGDLSLRAWQTLRFVDVIAAEDTRSSRTLLQAWSIETPLMAAHRHNEAQAAEQIIERLARKERVALVSDAGTPGISDPGGRIVRTVRQAGYQVVAVPGATSVATALMVSGATSDENPAFVFAGFMPPKAAARQKWLHYWCSLRAPVVMLESPHRLEAALADLLAVCGAERELTIARELTKRFEEVVTLPLAEVAGWLEADSHRRQGEFVLVVHEEQAASTSGDTSLAELNTLLDTLLLDLSVRDAVRVATRLSGLPRDTVYEAALKRAKQG